MCQAICAGELQRVSTTPSAAVSLDTRGYDFITLLAWRHELGEDDFLQSSLNFVLAKEYNYGSLHTEGMFSRGCSQYDASAPCSNEVEIDTFVGKIGVLLNHSESWS